jgi:hypothetical protein
VNRPARDARSRHGIEALNCLDFRPSHAQSERPASTRDRGTGRTGTPSTRRENAMHVPDEEEVQQNDQDNDGQPDDKKTSPMSLRPSTHATDPNIINKIE